MRINPIIIPHRNRTEMNLIQKLKTDELIFLDNEVSWIMVDNEHVYPINHIRLEKLHYFTESFVEYAFKRKSK